MIAKADINGNPFMGVFCRANDNVVLAPILLPAEVKEVLHRCLGGDYLELSLDGSPLLGSLIAMNNKGAVVTQLCSDEDLEPLRRYVNILRLPSNLNATGNNILANDNGALVHPDMHPKNIKRIQEVLEVPTKASNIAGVKTVGSAGVITNKGILVHPHTTPKEMESLEEFFGVEGMLATGNYGTPMPGACLVANTTGAVVGALSTPIELGRIEDGLKLY